MKNKTIQKTHGSAMVKKKKENFSIAGKTSSKRKLVLTRL